MMNDKTPTTSKAILHYAPPLPYNGRPMSAMVLAVVGFGFFMAGATPLITGIYGLVDALRHPGDWPGGKGIFETFMMTLVGAVCFFAGLRWFRHAWRLLKGT